MSLEPRRNGKQKTPREGKFHQILFMAEKPAPQLILVGRPSFPRIYSTGFLTSQGGAGFFPSTVFWGCRFLFLKEMWVQVSRWLSL